MVAPDVATDVVDVVCRRREILRYLLDEPRDKRTIVDDLDVPRTTLDRAIRELEAIDVVEYVDGEYAVTPVGERLVRGLFSFLDRVRLTMQLEPILQRVPPEEFDLDVRALGEAELLVPESGNPYVPIDRHVRRLGHADRVRGLLPFTGLQAHEAVHERVVEDGAEAELVVDPSVANVVVSTPPFAALTEEMAATNRLDLFVHEGSIPYFVGVFDDETVQIGVDEEAYPRALVETERQEVRAWAHETIDDYRRRATRLSHRTLRDLPSTSPVSDPPRSLEAAEPSYE